VNRQRHAVNGVAFEKRRPDTDIMFTRTQTLLLVVHVSNALAFGPQTPQPSPGAVSKLVAPANGRIPVAFVLTDGAVTIDFAGPWEVFQDVMIASRGASMHDQHVFDRYTVSDKR
jgi:hypothetical protein